MAVQNIAAPAALAPVNAAKPAVQLAAPEAGQPQVFQQQFEMPMPQLGGGGVASVISITVVQGFAWNGPIAGPIPQPLPVAQPPVAPQPQPVDDDSANAEIVGLIRELVDLLGQDPAVAGMPELAELRQALDNFGPANPPVEEPLPVVDPVNPNPVEEPPVAEEPQPVDPQPQPEEPQGWTMPGVTNGKQYNVSADYNGMNVTGKAKINNFDGKNLDMSLNVNAMGMDVAVDMKAQKTADGKLNFSIDMDDNGAKTNVITESYDIVSEKPGELVFRTPDGKQGSIVSDGNGGIILNHPMATMKMTA